MDRPHPYFCVNLIFRTTLQRASRLLSWGIVYRAIDRDVQRDGAGERC